MLQLKNIGFCGSYNLLFPFAFSILWVGDLLVTIFVIRWIQTNAAMVSYNRKYHCRQITQIFFQDTLVLHKKLLELGKYLLTVVVLVSQVYINTNQRMNRSKWPNNWNCFWEFLIHFVSQNKSLNCEYTLK